METRCLLVLDVWLRSTTRVWQSGGLAAVTRATGVLGKRIGMGLRELAQRALEPNEDLVGPERVRRPGAGRKRLTEVDETLIDDLESLVAPETRGGPESLLWWTTKNSLQALSKTREGTDHLDRDAQFRHINRKVREFHANVGTSKWKRDRASHVLVHHAELARTSAAQRSNRRQLDIEYLERAFCGHQPKAKPVPRRMELPTPPAKPGKVNSLSRLSDCRRIKQLTLGAKKILICFK